MNSKNIIINFLWKFCGHGLSQIITLVVSLTLARLITPAAYGLMAIAQVIISILQVFVDSGLGVALVQKKEADALDFSSVLFCNIAMCSCLYLLLFLSAPLISRIYRQPELIAVVRAVGVVVVIAGIRSTLQAYVERNLQFKKMFFATLIATLISGTVGMVMAFNDFGVWSIVTMNIVHAVVTTIVLWFSVKWRPKLQFSVERLKPLINYGSKILGSGLITSLYGNSRQLLVGSFYTTSDLAYYNKGNSFPNNLVPTIQASITSVLLPVIAKRQDNLEEVKLLTGKAVSVLSVLLWPMMMGLAACSETFVRLVLTEKWLPCVPYMQLFCLEAAIWPISSLYVNTIRAIGRSGLDLKIQTSLRIVGFTLLLIMVRFGPFYVAICALLCSLLEFTLLTCVNTKLIGFTLREQMKSLMPYVGMSVVMGVVVYLLGNLQMTDILLLIVQIAGGVVVYFLQIWIFKRDMIADLIAMLRGKVE